MESNFITNLTSLKSSASFGFWTFSSNDTIIVATYFQEYFDGVHLWRLTDRIRCFLLTSQMLVIRKKGPCSVLKRLAQPNHRRRKMILSMGAKKIVLVRFLQ